jgi:hypothetical protein
MISRHSSRPKNHSESASPKGTSPWYGERRAASVTRAASASRRPSPQQLALADPPHQVRRNQGGDALAGEVVDVVVLGDDERVALDVPAVDRAVDLQDHRALFECEVAVLGRAVDLDALPVRAEMDEPLLVPPRLVDDDVDRLARFQECLLERVVVVRRQDDLAVGAALLHPQDLGQLREEPVELVRLVFAAEDGVQLVDERARAADQVDPLRDAEQVQVGLRIPVRLDEVGGELGSARQVATFQPGRIGSALAEICAGAEEGNDAPETPDDDLAVAAERVDCGQVETPDPIRPRPASPYKSRPGPVRRVSATSQCSRRAASR